MPDNKHTPEPWRTDAECGFPQDIHDSKGNLFLRCGSDFDNEIYGEANARRIVACVNALEGLNDYALAGGWSFRGIEAYAKGLEKQRDELLAALETQATKDVITERRRQQIIEGWTTDHDDQHKNGEMPRAAGLYAISAGFASKYLDGETETCPVPDGWPWGPEWWKPTNSRRDLVKAAALILAEIERIDRATIANVKGEQ